MNRFLAASVLVLFSFAGATFAADTSSTVPVEGLRDASPRIHALVGGRIVVAPGNVIENGTLVLRDGVIEAVGADVTPPADARVWDVSGRTLYAGFIESDSTLFLPEAWKPEPPPRPADEGTPPPPKPPADPPKGAHAWNPLVTPERSAGHVLAPDPKGAKALRQLGFTLANVTPGRGAFRGRTALVSSGDGDFKTRVVRGDVAQAAALERVSDWGGGYPGSLMGAVALVRQTLLDAQWYAEVQEAFASNEGVGIERPETNDALAALGSLLRGEEPMIFEARDELDALRALKIAHEFNLKLILRGSGYEYRVLRGLDPDVPVIAPLNFPEPPDVEVPDQALDISLDQLEHWELAPANAARLADSGVPVVLTSSGLKKPEAEFWPRVRKAVQNGLSPDSALAALTTEPAQLFGVATTHGTLEVGRVASVVIASGDLFSADDSEIQLVWVDGEPYELDGWRSIDARGTWSVSWESDANGPTEFQITGETPAMLKASAAGADASIRATEDQLLLLAPGAWFGIEKGIVRLTGRIAGDQMKGSGDMPDGTTLRWTAERKGSRAASEEPEVTKTDATMVATGRKYPAGTLGRSGLPEQPASLLIRNATIWTCGPDGIIEGGDMLVERGVITRVGRKLAVPEGAVVIDASGKAVTPGIIDAHSHIATAGGFNEGAHAVTCEVRIGDVLDATDVTIYRQLAGGTTVANVLHGSANPIGGQCQVIKLRWGALPEELKFSAAMPSVKFALGENVKQSNWGDRFTTRYPQTRMGVREIMDDTFTRARDYERAWAGYRAGRSPLPPRRDLQLEAALEILQGERLVNIHSYRQDEVLAFIRLAQKWELPAIVFQHILEGYKVADEIAAIGAGASCFTDWWAYKYEVIDSIPWDGALMHSAGVLVSFNSDDGELGRRLNTEAAKAVKYGDLPPEEALKFVTINPARQLRVAERVGSLEAGKDADFVIWSGPPLSTFSRAEETWIDGRRYFSIEDDAALRANAAAERAALVQKILPDRQQAMSGGGGDKKPGAAPPSDLYGDGRSENCHDDDQEGGRTK